MNPRVVCNTGPLIALSLIGCQDILSKLFRPVVTQTVLDEWSKGAQINQRVLPESFDLVQSPPIPQLLAIQLDDGEASVVQTAISMGIQTVVIDERKGRKIARRVYGLKTIGTAGLLVLGNRRGLIGPLSPLFAKLQFESYWIAAPIVDWALKSVGE